MEKLFLRHRGLISIISHLVPAAGKSHTEKTLEYHHDLLKSAVLWEFQQWKFCRLPYRLQLCQHAQTVDAMFNILDGRWACITDWIAFSSNHWALSTDWDKHVFKSLYTITHMHTLLAQSYTCTHPLSHWLTHSLKLRIWGCALEPDHKVTLDHRFSSAIPNPV